MIARAVLRAIGLAIAVFYLVSRSSRVARRYYTVEITFADDTMWPVTEEVLAYDHASAILQALEYWKFGEREKLRFSVEPWGRE